MTEQLRLADYFVVVGLDESLTLNHPPHLAAPITDVVVILQAAGEKPPRGYRAVHPAVVSGQKAAAVVCMQHSKNRSEVEYITDIGLVVEGEHVPAGWHVVSSTPAGYSANLNPLVEQGSGKELYIMYRRWYSKQSPNLHATTQPLWAHDSAPAISEVCWCDANQPLPSSPGWQHLQKHLFEDKQVYNKTQCKTTIVLAFQQVSVGISHFCYSPKLVDRFPFTDHRDFPLPSAELPMYCFPHGVQMQWRMQDDAPPASYFSFILTDSVATSIHCCCVMVYEPVPVSLQIALEAKWLQIARDSRLEQQFESATPATVATNPRRPKFLSADQKAFSRGDTLRQKPFISPCLHQPQLCKDGTGVIFAPKCICVLSHCPFYQAFRQFLTQVYAFSQSHQNRYQHINLQINLSSGCSGVLLGQLIGHFMLQVPLPTPGGACLHFQLLPQVRSQPIQIFRPAPEALPLLDLPFDNLFRCLSVDNILTAMALLLLEKKVVVFSSYLSLPTEIVELLKALIFPFTWQCPCLPRLPDSLLGVLDCPTAFIVGIVKRDDTQHYRRYSGLSSRAPEREHAANTSKVMADDDVISIVRRQLAQSGASLPQDAYVIDLDNDQVRVESNFYDPIDRTDVVVNWRVLPREATTELQNRLKRAAAATGLICGRGDLHSVDTAYEFPPSSSRNHNKKQVISEVLVREGSLIFMLHLLRNYRTHVRQYIEKKDGNLLSHWFDVDTFIAHASESTAPFLRRLLHTQMFAAFIQDHFQTDAPNQLKQARLAFLNRCHAYYLRHLQYKRLRRKSSFGMRSSALRQRGPDPVPGFGRGGLLQLVSKWPNIYAHCFLQPEIVHLSATNTLSDYYAQRHLRATGLHMNQSEPCSERGQLTTIKRHQPVWPPDLFPMV